MVLKENVSRTEMETKEEVLGRVGVDRDRQMLFLDHVIRKSRTRKSFTGKLGTWMNW